MRAKTKIYHIDCFRCTSCARPLNPGNDFDKKNSSSISSGKYFYLNYILIYMGSISGDEFALRDGGALYCKNDHDNLEKSAQSRVAPIIESNNNTHLNNNNHSSELGSMSGE